MEFMFLPSAQGHLFVKHVPERSGHKDKCVLIVPPFAEESNKARYQVSRLISQLEISGFASVLFDFYGTGESEGRFEQSSLESYLADIQRVFNWCLAEYQSVSMVAIRLGALISLAAVEQFTLPLNKWVAWQPQFNGKQVLNQFFRLRIAGEMAAGGKVTSSDIQHELDDLGSSEIAGYRVSKQLARELEQANADNLGANSLTGIKGLLVMEVSNAENASLTPVNGKVVDRFRAIKLPVESSVVPGNQPWATQEITENQHLIGATIEFLSRAGA